jgi:hypothetical protein
VVREEVGVVRTIFIVGLRGQLLPKEIAEGVVVSCDLVANVPSTSAVVYSGDSRLE